MSLLPRPDIGPGNLQTMKQTDVEGPVCRLVAKGDWTEKAAKVIYTFGQIYEEPWGYTQIFCKVTAGRVGRRAMVRSLMAIYRRAGVPVTDCKCASEGITINHIPDN